jgi:hypothetical protein
MMIKRILITIAICLVCVPLSILILRAYVEHFSGKTSVWGGILHILGFIILGGLLIEFTILVVKLAACIFYGLP